MIQEYYKPATVQEAVELKQSLGAASYIGGGTKINHGSMGGTVEKVVSLEGLSLGGIKVEGDIVKLGSQVTLQEIADNASLPKALSNSARYTYSRNVRNMATLGGSIAAAKANCTILPALIALNASVETAENGAMSVEDYVSKNDTSLILSVSLPDVKGVCVTKKISRSCASLPVLTVAVRVASGDAAVVVSGVANSVVRLSSVEKGLSDGSLGEQKMIEDAVSAAIQPSSDIVGSADYKKYIAGVTVAECVEQCKKGEA